jgi:hypothetical protein
VKFCPFNAHKSTAFSIVELALAVYGDAKHTNAEKTADVTVLFFTSLLSVLILRVTSSVRGKGVVANNE